MLPTLFEIGPFEVRSYGVIVVIALLAAGYILRSELNRTCGRGDAALALVLAAALGGFVGARLYFLIEQLKERSPTERERIEIAERQFDLIGQLISLRLEAGTQSQLASYSGIHQSEISKIERGRLNPTKETLETLAHALGAHLANRARPRTRTPASCLTGLRTVP